MNFYRRVLLGGSNLTLSLTLTHLGGSNPNPNPNWRLKPVNAGTKLFKDMPGSDTMCQHRICQDGLYLVLPHITRQLLRLNFVEDMRALLDQEGLQATEFTDSSVTEAIRSLQCGPCVVLHEASGVAVAARCSRGGEVAAMVSREERKSLLGALH